MMRILDISAGRRGVWFDKNHRDAVYVDIRPEVEPTLVADSRKLPADMEQSFDLILFDPPHKNNGANGKMTYNYGHWTHAQIQEIVIGCAREGFRVAKPDGLMAFKWNDHGLKLDTALSWLAPWWEPLFGHGVSGQHRHKSMTSWVMLRRREMETQFFTDADNIESRLFA